MGAASNDVKGCGRAVKLSVLLNHYLGRFDHGGDSVAFFELKFVSTAASNCTLNQVIADSYDHVSHDVAQLNFFDGSTQFVSG
jgi:hypothetical protein